MLFRSLPAYHMNKGSWIGLLLEGPVSREELIWLLDISYELAIKQRKGSSR